MDADLNGAQLKYSWTVPACDITFSNEELVELCRAPCRVDIWRSNLCFKYFYAHSGLLYQRDMNDLEEHQKDVITKCMLENWKSFEEAHMNHDRYLRHQRSRRVDRIVKFLNKRHNRRLQKKLRLLANVNDSQASLFVPDISETESLDGTLYEPSAQDFKLAENPHRVLVEDSPQIEYAQEPMEIDYTDEESIPDPIIQYNINTDDSDSENEETP